MNINQTLENSQINEIILSSNKDFIVEHQGALKSFAISDEDKDFYSSKIINSLSKAPNYEFPIASGIWKNFRVQVLCPPVVQEKYLIQLRRISCEKTFHEFQPEQWSCNDKGKSILEESFSRNRDNFLIVGPTGCGKTTLLRSLIKSYCSHERIVTLEDTPELPRINNLSSNLKTFDSSSEDIKSVNLNDLVKASLRLRPDRLIMGEMRGAEAASFLLMLSTGHKGSGATLHAESTRDALYRLEMLVQMGSVWSLDTVRKVIRNSLQIVISVKRCHKSGKRIITEISRIVGLEESGFLLHSLYSAEDVF